MHGFALVATSLAILGLAVGSVRAARAAAGPWALPAFGVPALALGLFTTGLIVPVCLVARLAGRFDAGLGAAAVVGVGFAALSSRWAPTPGRPARPGARRGFAAALVLLLAVYGYVAWTYQMHDEHAVFGHKSMVEQLRRDVYPLYYPSAPAEEARYHYGFDIVAGALARAYGVSSDVAIDLVCLLMVAFMALGAAAVASDEGAERSAPFAALAVHFGAGLGWLLLAGVEGRHPRCLAQYHHPSCEVELFPTQFLNVFQHPVSVGVPMLLLLVLLLPRLVTRAPAFVGARKAPYAALALAALLALAAASVGQFVYYALGALAALAAAPLLLFGRGKAGLAGALTLAAVCAASLGLAYLQGGMLTESPSIDPNLVMLREVLGFPKETDVRGILYHHVVNLGVGFVLLPLFAGDALLRRRPGTLTLLAFALGGILVAHLFVYTRSWDIVKFPSAASFALSLLYVIVVDRALVALRYPWSWLRYAGAALLMGSGLVAAAFVVWPLDASHRLYDPGRWRADALVRQTIDWFHEHEYRSRDVIYAQGNVSKELSVFGGLSVVAQDADLFYMGVRLDELHRQRQLASRVQHRMDREALDALGIRYLVFSGEELSNLGAPARRALEDAARFEVVATFDGGRPEKTRRIWRRRKAPAQPSG